MNDSEHLGIVEILIGSMLWGTIGLFVLFMDRLGSSASLTAFLRMAFATVILFGMTLFHGGIRGLRISKKGLLWSALLGLVCQGLYNVFYNKAIVDTGMTLGAVLLNVAPLCTMVISHFVFKEKYSVRKWLGIFLCMAGCFITVTGGSLSWQTVPVVGIVCGVLSGASYGMTSVFGRLAGDRADVYAMSLYSYLFASLFLLCFSHAFLWEPWNGSILFLGFLYALIPTALAYILYYRGLQKIRENSRVPVIASTETVVAAIIGAVLFHESLSPIQYAGIFLVLFSIALMNGKMFHVKQKGRIEI
ncbi:EamA family transporter [uncultured Dialister sp.]|uniref:DMT family transporter n=1 Tax=uncultured Dialister sp. TaxID=278064 RepID=UPI0025EE2E27|nr:EamA family transporter [uncultured Dialister sp.]